MGVKLFGQMLGEVIIEKMGRLNQGVKHQLVNELRGLASNT